jgi:hypothetical protein
MSAAESRAKAMARNMSAPPRTTLTFSALAPASSSQEDSVDVGTGLRFVCRLDARSHVPEARRQTGADANAQDAVHIHQRIRAATLYARAEAAGLTEVSQDALDQIKAPPIEGLADELQVLIAAVPLAEDAFPAIGLLLPIKDATARPIMPGFARTLAVLGRRRGAIFVRSADPIVWTALQGEPLDLWLPAQAGARTREVLA